MTQSESAAPKKSLLERMPWAKKDKAPEPYPNPAKLAAVWSTESLTQVGRVPTRGFGGRIFFYDEKTRSVPVDGTLVIHGFDDKAEDPKTAVKRFEFTPEQLTSHFSQSDVGASYSVWIPWDAIGGEQRHISLVASFKTKEGKTLQGQPTNVLLPGTKADSAMALANRYSPTFGLGNELPPSVGTWNIARSSSSNSVDIAMVDRNDAPENGQGEPANAIASPAKTGTPQVMPASTRLK